MPAKVQYRPDAARTPPLQKLGPKPVKASGECAPNHVLLRDGLGVHAFYCMPYDKARYGPGGGDTVSAPAYSSGHSTKKNKRLLVSQSLLGGIRTKEYSFLNPFLAIACIDCRCVGMVTKVPHFNLHSPFAATDCMHILS
jgi:hypothetical protein